MVARPFQGKFPDYERTSERHDFGSRTAGLTTVLDVLHEAGLETISVGKISDIFAGRGVSEKISTLSNSDGMKKTSEIADRDFRGFVLCKSCRFRFEIRS